jgi:hypothetical protein
MAARKATRSNPPAQPRPLHAKTARTGDPEPMRLRPNAQPTDPQLKAHIFETLRHLNRGYGVALAAYDRLQKQDRRQKPSSFPQDVLASYRNRTEALRAEANRDLLRLMASREDLDAERYGRLSTVPDNPKLPS